MTTLAIKWLKGLKFNYVGARVSAKKHWWQLIFKILISLCTLYTLPTEFIHSSLRPFKANLLFVASFLVGGSDKRWINVLAWRYVT